MSMGGAFAHCDGMLPAAANALVRVLLAPVCPGCHLPLSRPLHDVVCGTCWRDVPRLVPPLCDRCGDALPPGSGPARACMRCTSVPPGFAAARSAGVYAGPLRALVHAFKYDGIRTLAGSLASLMRDAAPDMLAEADAVVPVPMHPWRALQRGFNHADDLARRLDRPVLRALRRTRHGPPQARLAGAQRHTNVAGAFGRGLSFSLWLRGRDTIRGRRLLLVDDVMTTGATLDACSRVLLEAGAARVTAITVARALAPPPRPPRHSPRPATVPHR